ncbi:MAG: hypothetical protein HOP29_10435 [Phycisphaerales bacterium]|nr:hypothetical protein [Phycisphaerales bacterium]
MSYADLLQIAYHEAGHAVIGRAHDPRIVRATIVPDAGRRGHVEFDRVPTDAVAGLSVFLAGPMAEHYLRTRTFAGLNGRPSFDVHASDDWSRMLSYLPTAFHWRDNSTFCLAFERTAGLLIYHWDHVEAVADALLTHKTITGAYVTALLSKHEAA